MASAIKLGFAHDSRKGVRHLQKNIGSVERVVRMIAGIGILGLFFVLEGDARYWSLLGLMPLGTALSGWCPPYAMFGFSSCPGKNG